MTKDEFINKIVGAPWVNRKSDFDGCDCFGLVKLYYYHVLGFKISEVKGYKQNEPFTNVFESNIELQWTEIDNYEDGAMAVFYMHGEPKHVALCVGDNKYLHSQGDINRPAKAELVKTRALKRLYNDVTYHKLQAFE